MQAMCEMTRSGSMEDISLGGMPPKHWFGATAVQVSILETYPRPLQHRPVRSGHFQKPNLTDQYVRDITSLLRARKRPGCTGLSFQTEISVPKVLVCLSRRRFLSRRYWFVLRDLSPLAIRELSPAARGLPLLSPGACPRCCREPSPHALSLRTVPVARDLSLLPVPAAEKRPRAHALVCSAGPVPAGHPRTVPAYAAYASKEHEVAETFESARNPEV